MDTPLTGGPMPRRALSPFGRFAKLTFEYACAEVRQVFVPYVFFGIHTECSGENVRIHRLARTFADRICDKGLFAWRG